MVAVAIPKIGDHGAVTAGHEPRLATRARATPAGALAWVAYVRVVISFCAFTLVIPDGQGITWSEDMGSRDPGVGQTIF